MNKFILKRETIHHFDCWSNGKRVGCTRPGLHARGEGGVRKVLLRTLNPPEYKQFSLFENNIMYLVYDTSNTAVPKHVILVNGTKHQKWWSTPAPTTEKLLKKSELSVTPYCCPRSASSRKARTSWFIPLGRGYLATNSIVTWRICKCTIHCLSYQAIHVSAFQR